MTGTNQTRLGNQQMAINQRKLIPVYQQISVASMVVTIAIGVNNKALVGSLLSNQLIMASLCKLIR
jgi:hypothetical protein